MRVVNPQTSNDLVDAVSHTVCCGLVQLLQLYSCSLWDDRERVSSAGFIRVPELNRGMKACVMAPPPPAKKRKSFTRTSTPTTTMTKPNRVVAIENAAVWTSHSRCIPDENTASSTQYETPSEFRLQSHPI